LSVGGGSILAVTWPLTASGALVEGAITAALGAAGPVAFVIFALRFPRDQSKKAGTIAEAILVPLLFAEVRLTPPAAGRVPKLNSRVSANNYVFVWDGRRDCGYLLVVPPSRAHGELLFDVRWGE